MENMKEKPSDLIKINDRKKCRKTAYGGETGDDVM